MIMNVANYYFKDVDEHKNVVYINKEIKDVSIFDIRNAANKYKKAN